MRIHLATRNLFDEYLKEYSRTPLVSYGTTFSSFINNVEVEEERKNMWKFEIFDQCGRRFALHQEGDYVVVGPVGDHGCKPVFSLEDLETILKISIEMIEANAALKEE